VGRGPSADGGSGSGVGSVRMGSRRRLALRPLVLREKSDGVRTDRGGGERMIIRNAAHTLDARDRPPASPPAVDLFAPGSRGSLTRRVRRREGRTGVGHSRRGAEDRPSRGPRRGRLRLHRIGPLLRCGPRRLRGPQDRRGRFLGRGDHAGVGLLRRVCPERHGTARPTQGEATFEGATARAASRSTTAAASSP
jgi:hypothetical protein